MPHKAPARHLTPAIKHKVETGTGSVLFPVTSGAAGLRKLYHARPNSAIDLKSDKKRKLYLFNGCAAAAASASAYVISFIHIKRHVLDVELKSRHKQEHCRWGS